MRLFTLSVVIVCQIFAFPFLAICQEKEAQPERLHLTKPFP